MPAEGREILPGNKTVDTPQRSVRSRQHLPNKPHMIKKNKVCWNCSISSPTIILTVGLRLHKTQLKDNYLVEKPPNSDKNRILS